MRMKNPAILKSADSKVRKQRNIIILFVLLVTQACSLEQMAVDMVILEHSRVKTVALNIMRLMMTVIPIPRYIFSNPVAN